MFKTKRDLPVVKLTDCSTSLNPNTIVFNINIDLSQFRQINNYKRCFYMWNIGQAFKIVTAASNTEMNSQFLGTYDGSLDVCLVNWFEYETRFRHWFGQVSLILSCRVKDFNEHRGVPFRTEECFLEWKIDICVLVETIDEVIL